MGDYAIYPTVQLTRSQSSNDAGVQVQSGTTHYHIEGLTIIGSRTSGVFTNGASHGLYRDLHTSQTMADGILTAHGSHDIRYQNILIEEPGDDGLSLVGWRDPTGKQLTNISIDGLTVRNQLAHGRGLVIAGVNGLVFSNVLAQNVYGAGILITQDSFSVTFGNRAIRGNNIILHTCGNNGSVPDGWTDDQYSAITVVGTNLHYERNEDIVLRDVVSINPRNYHVADNDVKDGCRGVTIENLSTYGGSTGVANILAPSRWTLRDWSMYNCGGASSIFFGGSNALAGNIIRGMNFYHANAGTPRHITGISCVSGDITLTYYSAHGYSGSPDLTIVGVGSDYDTTPPATTRLRQYDDEALNDTYGSATTAWAATTSKSRRDVVKPTTTNGFRYIVVSNGGTTGGSEPTWPTAIGNTVVDGTVTWRCYSRHYTSISFPDTTTVLIEGTEKADSWDPRIYTLGGSPACNAYTYNSDGVSTDLIDIATGTPVRSIDIDDIYLHGQCRELAGMLNENSTFSCYSPSHGAVEDKTGVVTSLSPGFTRRDVALNTVITAAQMLALNATPITLLPAISAAWAYRVKQFEATLIYNSAAYAGVDAGDDLVLRYTNGSGTIVAAIEATGFLEQASAQFRVVGPSSAVATAAVEQTPTANAALVLHMTGGEITTGNSTVRIRVVYDILRVTG
jgi:hypothetical protein